jgi:hypothetical protein
VEAEFRDAAGNVSEIVSDTIELIPDIVPPTIDAVLIGGSTRPYLLPEEPFVVEAKARDNIGGAGIDAFKVSLDDGDTWSDWIPGIGQTKYLGTELDRPEEAGPVTVTVVVRDRARNESDPGSATIHVVEAAPTGVAHGAKFAGKISEVLDVDTLALDLVRGDVLTVKLKSKAAVKKTDLDLRLDLCRPDGERLISNQFPENAKKVSILGYVVPETGRFLLVVRRHWESEAERGTYKLSVKVKQAAENKKWKGDLTAAEIAFDAAHGSTFKAGLRGEGLTVEAVSLVGPEGPVDIEKKGKPGRVTIRPVVLDAGTGTYRIQFPSELTVSAKWKVKPPRSKGKLKE